MGEKMSVTRALAELKLLDKRITKAIEQAAFIDIYQERNPQKALRNNETKTVFEKNAQSSYSSILDLISRRSQIKSAIIKSNAATEVTVNGVRMTVAEAIEKKNSIEYHEFLLGKMREQQTTIHTEIERKRSSLEEQIEEMMNQHLGANKKANSDDYENIARPFFEQNELRAIDPLDLKKKISELEAEIDGFLSEVDFILSESNARTEIEV